MALVHYGISVLLLAVTVAAVMQCTNPGTNVPWIPPSSTVDVFLEPFASMPGPHCCDAQGGPPIDLQEACHLCYELTQSTPGFAPDVMDCSKFYMCEPNGKGGFNTFQRECPMCTFWNQTQLACVQVWFDSQFCVQTGHQTDPPVSAVPEEELMFCIDFEDDDLIQKGTAYQPWILNRGVTVVADPQCPQGDRCGFFNESILEVPMFSNNYDPWHGLKITLKYVQLLTGQMDQGVISNDCLNLQSGAPGNSLYLSVDAGGNLFSAGLKDARNPTNVASASDPSALGVWQAATMEWVGGVLNVQVAGGPGSNAPFLGPIRNSHCPLVIGAFIKEQADTYFQGYMDEICFYKML